MANNDNIGGGSSATPILNTLFSWINNQQSQKQQQFENDLAQKQLDAHIKELADTAKQHKENLDTKQALLKLQLQEHYNNQYGNTQSTPTSALGQPQVNSQMTPSGDPNSPLNFSADASVGQAQPYNLTPQQGYSGKIAEMFPEGIAIDPNTQDRKNQQALMAGQIQANTAGSVAGAKAAATAPYQQSLEQTKTTNKQAEIAQQNLGRIAAAEQAGRNMKESREIMVRGMLSKAGIDAASRREVAQMKQKDPGLDSDSVLQGFNDVMSLQQDFNRLPSNEKGAVQQLFHSKGFIIPDQKKLGPAIGTVKEIDGLFDDIQGIIQKDSRDGPNGLGIVNRAGFVLPGTDQKADINQIKSRAGTLAATFDKQTGRKAEQEIIRIFSGVFDPSLTQKQNMNNLEAHRRQLSKSILGAFHGIPTDQVNSMLQDAGIVNFGAMEHHVATQAEAAPTGKVKVINPNGEEGFIPQEKLAGALKAGYKEAH